MIKITETGTDFATAYVKRDYPGTGRQNNCVYGKKREDSAGLRIIKRKNSELLTTSLMIDNKIINAKYNKDTLDKRITEYRNRKFEQD